MKECPHCHSTNFIKNGNTYYGKQNHKCKICKCQFVGQSAKKMPLLEDTARRCYWKGSARGSISRAVRAAHVFLTKLYEALPAELSIDLPGNAEVSL